ncbi:MAG: hypothetical protein AAGE52_06400 [Myxococcota bacterium]
MNERDWGQLAFVVCGLLGCSGASPVDRAPTPSTERPAETEGERTSDPRSTPEMNAVDAPAASRFADAILHSRAWPIRVPPEHRAAVGLPDSVPPDAVTEMIVYWTSSSVQTHYSWSEPGEVSTVRTRLVERFADTRFRLSTDLPDLAAGTLPLASINRAVFGGADSTTMRTDEAAAELLLFEEEEVGVRLEVLHPFRDRLASIVVAMPHPPDVTPPFNLMARHVTQITQSLSSSRNADLEMTALHVPETTLAALEEWARTSGFSSYDLRPYRGNHGWEGHVDDARVVLELSRGSASGRLILRRHMDET